MSAKDKGTGKEQKIRIEASSGLSDEEINRMKKEAEANAETDKREKEKIEKINQADSLIFQTEKQLKEYGDKVSEGNRTQINAALEKLKKAHSEQNVDGIDAAMNELNTVWQSAAQEMYAAGGGAEGGPQGAPGADAGAGAGQQPGGSADDVSDVEYEEVDDKNKK